MNAIKNVFLSNAFCQFGNPCDTNFKGVKNVAVVDHKPGIFAQWLVVDAVNGVIGLAIPTHGVEDVDASAEYYCTNARKIGGDWTVERALHSLGFPEAGSDRIKTILGWSVVQG